MQCNRAQLHVNTDRDFGCVSYLTQRYDAFPARYPGTASRNRGSFPPTPAGRWYVNIEVELPQPESPTRLPGIDLGLNSVAALSNGFEIAARKILPARGQTTRSVSTVRAEGSRKGAGGEIANRRRHFPHGMSHGLVRQRRDLGRRGEPEAGEDTGIAKAVQAG